MHARRYRALRGTASCDSTISQASTSIPARGHSATQLARKPETLSGTAFVAYSIFLIGTRPDDLMHSRQPIVRDMPWPFDLAV